MGSLIDLVMKLIDLIKKLLSKKCECVEAEEYDKIVSELDSIIKLLEDWMNKAQAGVVGEYIKQNTEDK